MFGSQLGGIAGSLIGKRFGGQKGQQVGQGIGSALGTLLPFKTGGRVKGKRPVKALLHPNEYVLPANAKPTAHQRSVVAKNKAKAKKHKKSHK